MSVGLGNREVVAHRAGEGRRALEDHADSAAERQRVERRDVVAAEAHDALVRSLEPVAAAQQRRLSRARRPDEHRHPGVGDLTRRPVESPARATRERDVLEAEQRGRKDVRIVAPRRQASSDHRMDQSTTIATIGAKQRLATIAT